MKTFMMILLTAMAPVVLCGGYSSWRELGEHEQVLFDSLYTASPALTPEMVATQVVAGTNYRYRCHDEKGRSYEVTIFVPLPCNAETQQSTVSVVPAK